ncbi:MAG: DUF523 and DUF1722 domain-containing protein [Candidatus Caldatribacterium sp.]|uniref:YbgA family protein n=1 Tax=Candidatus Caldatribacterium sp. TaxID=2282143 RepID=UPI002995B3C5|nr:DUF523 and DUF1722 domain-containing protein [Candidatus Caldatribacterium sp.]MCX7730588.1 DUF523 and DUF1722 domain-containing protein [Candidatus Caldatribacterium sp.]MDW8081074.1 DUF523 and DUF1722 domain-containing protein [Candidatus Calescibacterium sp.]
MRSETFWTRTFPRPKVVVSKCLGFAPCRYDGAIIEDTFVRQLRPYVDFVPVCPEVDIGLGVPRKPIRIVLKAGKKHLVQEETEKDLTEAMERFSENFLTLQEVHGFILKAKSPSCGLRDVKVHAPSGKVLSLGSGMFTEAVLRKYPHLAIESERRLEHSAIREHFLQKIFALADLEETLAKRSPGALVDFHTRYKLFLLAHHQQETHLLGKIVARVRESIDDALKEYRTHFLRAIRRAMNRRLVVNVFFHILGYFKDRITPKEKDFFLHLLEDFREGNVSLPVLINLTESWVIRFEEPYLSRQVFFRPYPKPLRPKDQGDLLPERDFWKEE